MKWTTQTHVNCYRNPLGEFGFSQGAKNTTAYMVSQTLIQKSYAKHLAPRRFSQKSFVDLDFGHHSCPFLKIFSTLVQIRIEKITKLFDR